MAQRETLPEVRQGMRKYDMCVCFGAISLEKARRVKREEFPTSNEAFYFLYFIFDPPAAGEKKKKKTRSLKDLTTPPHNLCRASV